MLRGSDRYALDSISRFIAIVVDERYKEAKITLETKNLSEDEYKNALAKIEEKKQLEMSLFDLNEIENYFKEFSELCTEIKPTLRKYKIRQMFTQFIEEVFVVKLKLLDAASGNSMGSLESLFGKSRMSWSPRLAAEIEEFREKLDVIFMPLQEKISKKTGLYSESGLHRADATRNAMHLDHPLGKIHDKLEKTAAKIFKPDKPNKEKLLKNVEKSLDHIIWSALSQQYVLNTDGTVDVFLPDGEISTASIFWNTELNKLMDPSPRGNPQLRASQSLQLESPRQSVNLESPRESPQLERQSTPLESPRSYLSPRAQSVSIPVPQITYHRLNAAAKESYNQYKIEKEENKKELSQIKKLIEEFTENHKGEDLLNNKDFSALKNQESAIEARKKEIEDRLAKHCSAESNWEIIPFGELKFKGSPLEIEKMRQITKRITRSYTLERKGFLELRKSKSLSTLGTGQTLQVPGESDSESSKGSPNVSPTSSPDRSKEPSPAPSPVPSPRGSPRGSKGS